MKQERNEDQLDAILRSAFRDHAKTMERELETKEELQAQGMPPHQFSPDFERKMKRLARKTKGNLWRGPKSKWGQAIAAAGAAVVIGVERIIDWTQ